jgi:hypothetical protein
MTGDTFAKRRKRYAGVAQRCAASVDPNIQVYWGDGEIVEGPAVCLEYPRDTDLPLDQQERRLEQVAEALRAAEPHELHPVLVRVSDDAVIPFIEIPCDIEHHRRVLLTLASAPPDQREDLMRHLGISPAIARLTRDIIE